MPVANDDELGVVVSVEGVVVLDDSVEEVDSVDVGDSVDVEVSVDVEDSVDVDESASGCVVDSQAALKCIKKCLEFFLMFPKMKLTVRLLRPLCKLQYELHIWCLVSIE